ncbi:uncharacterized protein LOC135394914 isoform X2 [Ornithodoros turicata]
MAALESVGCCELFAAGVCIGVYTMIVYLGAFIMELWWIIEYNIQLPVPAYILAAGYFSTFLVSLFLLAGLFLKKSKYLLGWLFVSVVFFFPECGLALFMSLKHWKLDDKGIAELAFYICRAVVNVVCIICIQSLYTLWRQEKAVMRRLENLNVLGKENGGPSPVTVLDMRSRYGGQDSEPTYIVTQNSALRRSASSASNLLHARSLSGSNGVLGPAADRDFYTNPSFWNGGRSEFDASSFYDYFARGGMQNGGSGNGHLMVGYPLHRSASDLQGSFWGKPHVYEGYSMNGGGRESPSANGSAITHVDYCTQSLDRPKFRRQLRRQKSTSLEQLNVRCLGAVTLERLPERPFDYLQRPGSRLRDRDSDVSSSHSIRDIAL